MYHNNSTNEISTTRKIRPGPKGTSCLTCKRRHKKCDERLPVCERCEKGGFECLGYVHNLDRRVTRCATQPPRPRWLIAPQPSNEESVSSGSSHPSPLLETGWSETEACNSNATTSDLCLWKSHDKPSPFAIRVALKPTGGSLSTFRKLVNPSAQLPYSPSDPLKTFLSNPIFDDYLMAQHEKLMEQWYFKPTNNHHKRFRQGVVTRLQGSQARFSRWIALIGMGICESFLTGNMSQIPLHNTWINYLEGALRRELSDDTTSYEIQERRGDLVHISLLKTMIIHASDAYQVLRNLTPTFLQIVFSDPTLWPSGCDPTCIPLSNVLCSEAHEFAYFALVDCCCALAFGLPQQLEYDTTIHPESNNSSHQWAHGCPSRFQLVLAAINACRDRSSSARDWRDIEHWLLTWQSRPGEFVFTESWMTIAWYAVQESWRLMLLTYLYLAVCNVSSDDPRIQSCVAQMLPVIGTVKKRESSGAEVSFFIQYLIAGICARTEAHRRVVRDALTGTNEPRFWVMRGSDFVPVLDHLWHGVASGGRPIRWGDYMRSREAVLPVKI